MPTKPKKNANIQTPLQMNVEDTVKFLHPLIDVTTCRTITRADLYTNTEDVLTELYQTAVPALLRINHCTLLLCDPKTYVDLEQKRQWLLAGCTRLEDAIRAVEIKFPDPQLQKLDTLNRETAGAKTRLNELERERRKTKKNITCLEKQSKALIASLQFPKP